MRHAKSTASLSELLKTTLVRLPVWAASAEGAPYSQICAQEGDAETAMHLPAA